jgi:aminopeptidase-like protein
MSSQFSTDSEQDGRKALERLLCFLSLADGTRTVLQIAEHIGCSVRHLEPIAKHLEAIGILEDLNR